MTLYQIHFYRDPHGREPVLDYMRSLADRHDKDSRIKLAKINDYIEALHINGTQLGEPYVKHLGDGLWELRPLRDRILFVAWNGDGYILLHQFMKTTQRTPRREIAKARREIADLRKRGLVNE